MKLVDLREYPDFFPGTSLEDAVRKARSQGGALPPGQYGLAWQEGDGICLARDPLGCVKLFYGYRNDGALVVANRISRLAGEGLGPNEIRSCPAGRMLRVAAGAAVIIAGEDVSATGEDTDFDLPRFQQGVAKTLAGTMTALSQRHRKARFAVCLSGGLDSSVVAALAVRHLPNVTAFSFSYQSQEQTRLWLETGDGQALDGVSEDFRNASAVAHGLGVPLVPAFRAPESVAAAIEPAIRLGQDYRDFNVHCAVVNLFLAQEIRARFPGEQVIVLTGDLMNEYVCDYRAEAIDGVTYYPQPRVPAGVRRRFFVRGLDAGDREIGVFNAFGLDAVQPFHSVADKYMTVPARILDQDDCKWLLNSHLLPEQLQACVGRAKRRAQVGGADGGTLGVFHRMGMGEDRLLDLWARGLGAGWRSDEARRLIEFGRYRTQPAG